MTLPYEKCFSNYIRGTEEAAFNGFFAKSNLVSSPQPSIVSMILESLEKIPLQHKKDLVSNLVLAGGNTKIQNF